MAAELGGVSRLSPAAAAMRVDHVKRRWSAEAQAAPRLSIGPASGAWGGDGGGFEARKDGGARHQISIASLVSDSPSTYDEYIAQQAGARPVVTPSAVDTLGFGAEHVKAEPAELEPFKTPQSSPRALATATATATTSTIPPAFQHSQAFTSARDFFVPPALDGSGDGSRLVCTICQISLGNRVYSLKRHLFRHHPHVFRVRGAGRKPEPADAALSSPSSLASSPASTISPRCAIKTEECQCDARRPDPVVVLASRRKDSSPRGDSDAHSTSSLGKRKHLSVSSPVAVDTPTRPDLTPTSAARMNDAFTQWLSSDVIPMEAVRSTLFRQFIALVNPSFKIPKVVIQSPTQLDQHCKLHGYKPERSDTDAASMQAGTITPRRTLEIQERPRTIKAVCIQSDGAPVRLVNDLPMPTPRHDEALVRVLRAGICSTDLGIMRGYKPGFTGILGHEMVGIVEQLGSDAVNDPRAQAYWVGRRVVAEINLPCRNVRGCETCAAASVAEQMNQAPSYNDEQLSIAEIRRRNHCPNRQCLGIIGNVGGAFAEYVALPLRNLHVVPDTVVDAHAVFAEPLAAACRVTEQGFVKPSDDVAVIGDGKLGLLIAETLHAQHAAQSVALIGKHRDKLALAKHFVTTVYGLQDFAPQDKDQDQSQHQGTQSQQHIQQEEQKELVERVTKRDGRMFDVCVDATGSPSSINTALKLLKPGGAVVVKSTVPPSTDPLAAGSNRTHVVDVRLLCRNRLRLRGSRCGPIPEALRLLHDRRVDVQKLIGGVYPLARAESALAHAGTRGALKVQLFMGD